MSAQSPSPDNMRIVLAARPHGAPTPADFRIEHVPLVPPEDGEVLLRTRFLSLDPYMRGRMDDRKSYAPPIAIDAVMGGEVVAEIAQSRHAAFAPGDLVLAYTGWQSAPTTKGRELRKLDMASSDMASSDMAGLSPSLYLGVLGMPGFTAWSGMRNIGKPRAGETVVVAAATGPVGAAVGQLARIAGARAVGIAGGPAKCAALRDEFGFDVAIDHRAPGMAEALAAACPDGIDVYFENVGGPIADAVAPLLNQYARVPVCGLIAAYNATSEPTGPDRLPRLMREVLTKSLTIRGFINTEFLGQAGDFAHEMGAWVRDGRMRYREDIVDGLDQAPVAFIGLLEGRNFGKLVIRL